MLTVFSDHPDIKLKKGYKYMKALYNSASYRIVGKVGKKEKRC
jgi:hypothetical protein